MVVRQAGPLSWILRKDPMSPKDAHYFFYSSHTTYTKMCRLLLIDKMFVPSHHIRTYVWCHNIPNHGDVTGSFVTSSCTSFAAGVVMTPLLTSLTTKCSW